MEFIEFCNYDVSKAKRFKPKVKKIIFFNKKESKLLFNPIIMSIFAPAYWKG